MKPELNSDFFYKFYLNSIQIFNLIQFNNWIKIEFWIIKYKSVNKLGFIMFRPTMEKLIEFFT